MNIASRRRASALIVALLALCLAAATILPAASASDGPTASIAKKKKKKKCKKKGKKRALAAKKKCKKKKDDEGTPAGAPASIVATPASHDFGTQLPGTITVFEFTLANPGDTAVQVLYTDAGVASDGFADFIPNLLPPVAVKCANGIPPHASCQFAVTFKAPPTPGTVTGTVKVDDHAGASVAIPVSGTTGL